VSEPTTPQDRLPTAEEAFAERVAPVMELVERDPVRQAGVDSSAFEVAIGHAAWGGIWAGSGSAAGGVSSAMASTCM
jgi:hypothetical protein